VDAVADDVKATVWFDYSEGGGPSAEDVYLVSFATGEQPYNKEESSTEVTGPMVMKTVIVSESKIHKEKDFTLADEGHSFSFAENPEEENLSSFDSYTQISQKTPFYFFRGETYKLHINASSKGFYLQTTPSLIYQVSDQYTEGMSPSYIVDTGTITWKIPDDAPGQIYYRATGFYPLTHSHDITTDGRKILPHYSIFLSGFASSWIRGDYAINYYNDVVINNTELFLENYGKKDGAVFPTLERGRKYSIHIINGGPYPFPSVFIRIQDSSSSYGAGNNYDSGFGWSYPTLHWTVPMDAPNRLWFRVSGEDMSSIYDPYNYRYIDIVDADLEYQEQNPKQWWGGVKSEHFFQIANKPEIDIDYEIDFDNVKFDKYYNSGEVMPHQHIVVFKKSTSVKVTRLLSYGLETPYLEFPQSIEKTVGTEIFPRGSRIIVDRGIRTGSMISFTAGEGSEVYSNIPFNNIEYSGTTIATGSVGISSQGFPNKKGDAYQQRTISEKEKIYTDPETGEKIPADPEDVIEETQVAGYEDSGTPDSLPPAEVKDASTGSENMPWQESFVDSGDGSWPLTNTVVDLFDESVLEEYSEGGFSENIVPQNIKEVADSSYSGSSGAGSGSGREGFATADTTYVGLISFDVTRTNDRFWALRFNIRESMDVAGMTAGMEESGAGSGNPFVWHSSNSDWINAKNIELGKKSAYYNVPIYLKMTNPVFKSFDGCVGAEGSTIDFKSLDSSNISKLRTNTTYGFYKNHKDVNTYREEDPWFLYDTRAYTELAVYEPSETTICTHSLRFGAPYWIFFSDSWNTLQSLSDSPKTKGKQAAVLFRWPVFDKAGADYGMAPYNSGMTRPEPNGENAFLGYRWILSLGGSIEHHKVIAATQIDTTPKLPPNQRDIISTQTRFINTTGGGPEGTFSTPLNSDLWDDYYSVGFWPWDSSAVWDLVPALPCPWKIGNDAYRGYEKDKVVGVSSPSIYLDDRQTCIDSGQGRGLRYQKGLSDETYPGALESTSGEKCTTNEILNPADDVVYPETGKITLTEDELTKFKLIAMNSEFGGAHDIAKWVGDVNIKVHWVANDGTSLTPTAGDIDEIKSIASEINSLTQGITVNVITGGVVDECETYGDLPGDETNPDVHYGVSVLGTRGCSTIPSNVNFNIYITTRNRYALINPSASSYVSGNNGLVYIAWGNGIIQEASCFIWENITGTRRFHIIREEMIQAFGLLNDSNTLGIDSIFYQGYSGVATSFSDIDRKIISTLYDPSVTPGMTESEIDELLG
jgi:hypothetical protein